MVSSLSALAVQPDELRVWPSPPSSSSSAIAVNGAPFCEVTATSRTYRNSVVDGEPPDPVVTSLSVELAVLPPAPPDETLEAVSPVDELELLALELASLDPDDDAEDAEVVELADDTLALALEVVALELLWLLSLLLDPVVVLPPAPVLAVLELPSAVPKLAPACVDASVPYGTSGSDEQATSKATAASARPRLCEPFARRSRSVISSFASNPITTRQTYPGQHQAPARWSYELSFGRRMCFRIRYPSSEHARVVLLGLVSSFSILQQLELDAAVFSATCRGVVVGHRLP